MTADDTKFISGDKNLKGFTDPWRGAADLRSLECWQQRVIVIGPDSAAGCLTLLVGAVIVSDFDD